MLNNLHMFTRPNMGSITPQSISKISREPLRGWEWLLIGKTGKIIIWLDISLGDMIADLPLGC